MPQVRCEGERGLVMMSFGFMILTVILLALGIVVGGVAGVRAAEEKLRLDFPALYDALQEERREEGKHG